MGAIARMFGPEHVRAMENGKKHLKVVIDTPYSQITLFDGVVSNSSRIANEAVEAIACFRKARGAKGIANDSSINSDSFFGEAVALHFANRSLCENPVKIRERGFLKTVDNLLTYKDIRAAARLAAASAASLDPKNMNKVWFHAMMLKEDERQDDAIREFARAERLCAADTYSLAANKVNQASLKYYAAILDHTKIPEGISFAENALSAATSVFETARKGLDSEAADERCQPEKYLLMAAFGTVLRLYELAGEDASPETKKVYHNKYLRVGSAFYALVGTGFTPNGSCILVNPYLMGNALERFYKKKH